MQAPLRHRPTFRVLHAAAVFVLAALSAGGRSYPAHAAESEEAVSNPGIWCLDFSPDGKWLAAASNVRDKGGPIVVWSTADWQPHIVHFEETGGLHVSFSPDGKLVAYSTRDATVGLLDVATGELERQIEAHEGTVFCVVFTPDGGSLVTSGDDARIKQWDAATGTLQRTFEGHADTVDGVAVSPDSTLLLSGSNDRTARLWDFKTGEVKQSFGPRMSIVRRVAFSPDGRYFIVSSWDGRCRVHDTSTGRVVVEISGGDCGHLTPDNRFLATAGLPTAAQVFRVDLRGATQDEADEIRELIGRFRDDDYDVREAASARIAEIGLVAEPLLREAMQAEDAEVRLRSRRTRDQVRSPDPMSKLSGHAGDIEVVSFSPDGKLLATGCRSGDLKVWSVPEFEEVVTLHAPAAP